MLSQPQQLLLAVRIKASLLIGERSDYTSSNREDLYIALGGC
jgi:hypothetical protein